MIQRGATIYEFETSPVSRLENGRLVYDWEARRSIDLVWVASAEPNGDEATSITMAGNGRSFDIRCPYERFMNLWGIAKMPRMRTA